MTTHRKGFVQYCKKPRTSQQCQRPACHVHLRGACGRDVGDVEEGTESGRMLSRESEILLPLLVEMLRSRANRIFSSELDTGIGTVSSALIRDFAIRSAASSEPSVSSRPSSSSSHCPSSAVRSSSSSSPSTCEFAMFARISTSATTSILTFRSKLAVTAGRPVIGSISALSTGALLHARDRAVDSSTMSATGTPSAASPARLSYALQPQSYSYTIR